MKARTAYLLLVAALLSVGAAAQDNHSQAELFRLFSTREEPVDIVDFAGRYDFGIDYETFEVVYRRSIVEGLTTEPGTSYMLRGITAAGAFCPVTAVIGKKGEMGMLVATPVRLSGDRSAASLFTDLSAHLSSRLGEPTPLPTPVEGLHIWQTDGARYDLALDSEEGSVILQISYVQPSEALKAFRSQRSELLEQMNAVVSDAGRYGSEVLAVWYEAVHNNRYGKRYVRDFNTALRKYLRERGRDGQFTAYCARVDGILKTITDYSGQILTDQDFLDFKRTAACLSELHAMVLSPAGTYNAYQAELKGLLDDCKKELSTLR